MAAALHVHPRDLVFTSGATESATLAIRGALAAAPPGRTGLVITAVEHPCVLDLARELSRGGTPVQVVPVDRRGVVDLEVLAPRRRCRDRARLLHARQQRDRRPPARRRGGRSRARRRRPPLLRRGPGRREDRRGPARAAGRPGGDHRQKFGGPRGAGALWIAPGVRLAPLAGGHQERGRRAGTENLPGLAGMGAALEAAVAALPVDVERVRRLRDRLEAGLVAAMPGARVNGGGADRLPGTLSITFPGSDGETMLMALDLEGICASAGAACTSGSTTPSHVLSAMGLTVDEARATLRLSLGWSSVDADVDHALRVMPGIVSKVREALSAP